MSQVEIYCNQCNDRGVRGISVSVAHERKKGGGIPGNTVKAVQTFCDCPAGRDKFRGFMAAFKDGTAIALSLK